MSTPERRAYRAAWRTRLRTGDGSTDLLIAELLAHNADPTWTDPNSELHGWLMDCWRRGVAPRRLPFEAIKKGASFVPPVARAFREIYRSLR
jgi:hypothetical protein